MLAFKLKDKLLCLARCIHAINLDYGLFIRSYPYKRSEMGALVLENGNSIGLNGEVTVSFDMYVRDENVFGNVFRIIKDEKENIDLLFSVGDADRRYPILVINESVYPLSLEVVRGQWMPVSISLSPSDNEIRLVYGETEQSVSYNFSRSSRFTISFGACPFPNFTLLDVASVNIRNIRLFRENKLYRFWKLEKHNNELCYDSLEQVPAIATNPLWLIDDHISWDKIFETKLAGIPSITFNPDTDDFYFVSNSEEITVFNAVNLKQRTIAVTGGLYAANSPNQLLYLAGHNALLSYNLDQDIYSFFSFRTNQWSSHTPNIQEHSYWNNSVVYNPNDSSILSFGGYGFYKYNHELLKKYPFGNKSPERTFLSSISPRYAAGTALVDNTLFIFGGRGNKTGRQELFPRNYYDFYAVNLQTNQVNKLWEIADVGETDFISGENLIYDPREGGFYMFTTKDGGTLFKITAGKAHLEPMSLPIGQDIEAQFLYVNLYYSPSQQKLYALIHKSTMDDHPSEITVYAISYPLVSVATLLQQAPLAANPVYTNWGWIVLMILLLAVVGYYFFYPFRRGKIKVQQKHSKGHVPTPVLSDFEYTFDFSRRCICFLGGFHIRDKNGEDITPLFTPTLKALLILLVLYSGENSRGMQGKKMLQLLWSDKTENSAKNNRNVYLSKLRVVLEKIGNIDVVTENGFWSIKFGNDVICDYVEAMRFFSILKESRLPDENQFDRILGLLLRGTLLPNTETDWIDRFKSDFSNLAIDLLTPLLANQDVIGNPLKLKIAETLFQHDFINEDALHIKCKILSDSGKMGLAKTFYDNYCKEYYHILGSKYRYSLVEVLEGENLKR